MLTPKTDAVLLFDANLSGPFSCKPGCRKDTTHLCRHRFGEHKRILAERVPVRKSGASDLEVVRYFVKLAREGIRGATITETRWIIVTRDKRFLRSAEHDYNSITGIPSIHLVFTERGIWAVVGRQILCIELAVIGSKQFGSGKNGDLQRALRCVQHLMDRPRPS